MTEFKVGDGVVVGPGATWASEGHAGVFANIQFPYAGSFGTVINVAEHGPFPVLVEFPGRDNDTCRFRHEELELA